MNPVNSWSFFHAEHSGSTIDESGPMRSSFNGVLFLEKEVVRLETFPSFLRESVSLTFRDIGEEELQVTSGPKPFSTSATSKSPCGNSTVQALCAILNLHTLVPLLLDLLFEHEKEFVVFVIREGEFVRNPTRGFGLCSKNFSIYLLYPGRMNTSFPILFSTSAGR